MARNVFILLGLVSLMLAIVSCGQQQVTQEQLLSMLDSLEIKLEFLDFKVAQETWAFFATGESDSLEYYQQVVNELVQDPNIINQLQVGKSLLTEEIDKRRLELILSSVLWNNVEADAEIASARDSLVELDQEYRSEFEGQVRSRRYLLDVFRYDSNRQRRQSAYRAWCSSGDQIADGLAQLFRARNLKAQRLGYNNFLALVFNMNGLSTDEYRGLLSSLDSLTRKPYLNIIDRIAAKLNLDQVERWDVGYAYADINSAVDRYLPADSQLTYIKQSLKAMDLNLDKLPVYFDLDFRETKSQYAFSFPIKPPHDIRILGNLSDGLLSTYILLHEVGHAVHFASVVQDRLFFARNMEGAWAEGMAQSVAALLREKKWLTEYAKLPSQLADSYLTSLKEQNIINLRFRLLLLDFEFQAYMNPNRDINKLYWDLFEKYLRLPRHSELKPWAAVIHYTSIPVYMQNYLYADVIAAQNTHFIKENYGGLVDNPRASAFLVQNYFRFGGRYHWRELLERGTDENLNVQYLVENLGL